MCHFFLLSSTSHYEALHKFAVVIAAGTWGLMGCARAPAPFRRRRTKLTARGPATGTTVTSSLLIGGGWSRWHTRWYRWLGKHHYTAYVLHLQDQINRNLFSTNNALLGERDSGLYSGPFRHPRLVPSLHITTSHCYRAVRPNLFTA